MSKDAVDIILLCEDQQHACFVRRFLVKQGCNSRRIRTRPCPSGRGSGEQFVRENFVSELRAFRSRHVDAKCLIVMTDADDRTVQNRVDDLAKQCSDAAIPFRQAGERIAFVIPKWNIESWLAYLKGTAVDESKPDYSGYSNERDCQTEVNRLDEMCRIGKLTPDSPPPSLVAACVEFRNLKL